MSEIAAGRLDAVGPATAADEITDVECFDCTVSLPRPLQVGAAVVAERSYVLTRIRTESGGEGVGFAFGRSLPVAEIIRQRLAPMLVGRDASRPEEIRHALAGANWSYGETGLFQVALSCVDLALWDLLGKRANLPLADVLGRRRTSVPCCFVVGYTPVGEDGIASLEVELEGLAALAPIAAKLTVGAASAATDARRVALAREALGDDCLMVVDCFRMFANLDDALRRLRLLEPYDLAYVEDPFSESLPSLVADLRRRSGLSIGLGEALSGHRAYVPLLEAGAVDVVRCDATVVGGVREFMSTAALASARGLCVSAHVHPEIHIHFAAAIDNIHPAGLEVMLPESGTDAFHRLLSSPLQLIGGIAQVPGNGLGLDIDWEAVSAHARS